MQFEQWIQKFGYPNIANLYRLIPPKVPEYLLQFMNNIVILLKYIMIPKWGDTYTLTQFSSVHSSVTTFYKTLYKM